MPTMFVDSTEAEPLLAANAQGEDRFTECWEGVTVVPPMPNNEHYLFQMQICQALYGLIDWKAGERVQPGGNVSDRDRGWEHDYRGPDVVVYLKGNPAINHDTHWEGGPDFLVEVISRGEDPAAKFEFYARIGTREILIVERNPWALELFRLENGDLVSTGRSEGKAAKLLRSAVLPFTFRLKPAKPRPILEMTNTATGQVWTA